MSLINMLIFWYKLLLLVLIFFGWKTSGYSYWCNENQTLPNGHASCNNIAGQFPCTVYCNEGYTLINNTTDLNCYVSLQDQVLPKCVGPTCEPNELPENIFAHCTNANKISSICTFQCLTNWKLIGAQVIECNIKGEWNVTQPTCTQDSTERVQISGRIAPDECGNKNIDVMFILDGSSSSVEFTESISLTKAFVTGLKASIDNGIARVAVSQGGSKNAAPCESSSSGSNYTIELNMEEKNESDIQDNIDGVLWFETNTCPLYGDSLVQSQVYFLEYGRPSANKIIVIFLSNSVKVLDLPLAEQANNQGIVIIAVGKNKTEADLIASTKTQSLHVTSGTYSELNILAKDVINEARDCSAKDKGECGNAGTVENGEFSCLYLSDVGEICQYICNEGYFLNGSSVLRCNLGLTEWDFSPPTCKNNGECPSLPLLINGNTECSNGNAIDSDCSFTCNDNFFRRGSGSAKCLTKSDGEAAWNDELPICETDLLCEPALVTPDNAELSCPDGNRYNSLCTVSCLEGFVLVGNRTIRCNIPKPDGGCSWNSELPSCGQCVKEPCEHDVLVVIDTSGLLPFQDFDDSKAFLLTFINTFGGAVESGDIHLGVVQVIRKAELVCDSGDIDEEFDIALDLDSYTIPLITSKIDEIEHVGGCSGASEAVLQSAEYFKVVGRGETNRVLILLTNQMEVATDAATIASDNEIKVLAVGVGDAPSEVLSGIVGSKGEYIHVKTFDERLINDLKDVIFEGFIPDPNAKKSGITSIHKTFKFHFIFLFVYWNFVLNLLKLLY